MRTRLTGLYGDMTKGSLGSEVTTGTLVDGTLYLTTAVGETSALPTGTEVGYVFRADGTEDITSSGDKVVPITLSKACDVQTWSIEASSAEINVTTACDTNNTYLPGRTDISGSAEGVYTIGATDVDGGFANSFFDIVRQEGDGGEVTIDKIDSDPIIGIFYKQKDQSVGETEQFYIAPITQLTFSDGSGGDDASTFSLNFRIAPSTETGLLFQLFTETRSA